MQYKDAKLLDGKKVKWQWSKGMPPWDAGGVGVVTYVDESIVRLALTGLHPVRGQFDEQRTFPLHEIEMAAAD